MPRVAVYVDGFNLYHGALERHPDRKWLDLQSLGQALAAPGDLAKARYFTAWVSGKLHPDKPRKQQAYVRALRSLPLVETHFGHFKVREKKRPLARPVPGIPPLVTILNREEKGSDVNLATWLMVDGMDDVYDEAIVVSNDTDLVEPIRQAGQRFGPVHVVSPHSLTKKLPYTFSYEIDGVAASYRQLEEHELIAAQLPETVHLPNGKTVTRPRNWR